MGARDVPLWQKIQYGVAWKGENSSMRDHFNYLGIYGFMYNTGPMGVKFEHLD